MPPTVAFWNSKIDCGVSDPRPMRPSPTSAADDGDVDDDVSARIVDDCVVVVKATPVIRRERNEPALDNHGEWPKLLLPARRQPAGPIELLLKSWRQSAVPRLVVLAKNANVTGSEVAAPHTVGAAEVVVLAVARSMRASVFVF